MSVIAPDVIATWRNKDMLQYIMKDLDKRVKRDYPVKASVLFTGLSAYIIPINLFLCGPPGVGKTHNTVKTLEYFSEEDCIFLGGLSPKALIHQKGKLLNKHGEPIDVWDKPKRPKKRDHKSETGYYNALQFYRQQLEEWNEELRNSYTLIDLTNKILVFLDNPDFATLEMLLPILSHDKEQIEYQFTDKQLTTQKVIIQGHPASIFLDTRQKKLAALVTRGFTATPEASKKKFEEAMKHINLKSCYPWRFVKPTEETIIIQEYFKNLRSQLQKIDGVMIPFLGLYELFPREIIRDMRDYDHFEQLLKTVTALYFYQRPFIKINEEDKELRYIICTMEDVKRALKIYKQIFETTRTGVEKRILDFYHKIVKTKQGWYLKELTAKYNMEHKEKKLSSDRVRSLMERLSEIGYVDVQKDEQDKRLNRYIPLIEEEDEKSVVNRILKMQTLSEAILRKSFDSWEKNILGRTVCYKYNNFDKELWGEMDISLHDVRRLVFAISFMCEQNKTRIVSNGDSDLDAKKKGESIRIPEIRTIVDISGVRQ